MPLENAMAAVTELSSKTKIRIVTPDGESKNVTFETLQATLSGTGASDVQEFAANNFTITNAAGALALVGDDGEWNSLVRSAPNIGGAQLGNTDNITEVVSKAGVRLWTPQSDVYTDTLLYAGDGSSVNFPVGETVWTETTIASDMCVDCVKLNVLTMPDGAAKIRIAYHIIEGGESIGIYTQSCTEGEFNTDLGQLLVVGENTISFEVPGVVSAGTVIRPVYYLDKQVNFEGSAETERIKTIICTKDLNRNELIYSDSNGNVVLGDITGDPTAMLDMRGTGASIAVKEVGAIDDAVLLSFSEDAADGFYFSSGFSGLNAAGNALRLNTFWAQNATVWRGDGNTGFGSTDPAGKVHAYDSGSIATRLIVDTPGTGIDHQAILELHTKGNGTEKLGVDANTTGWEVTARGNAYTVAGEQNDFHLGYWDGTDWLTGLQITPDGKAAFGGVTDPSTTVHINGSFRVADGSNMILNVSSTNMYVDVDDYPIIIGEDQDYSLGYNSADDTFRIAYGSDLTTSPGIIIDSSGKLDVSGDINIAEGNAYLQEGVYILKCLKESGETDFSGTLVGANAGYNGSGASPTQIGANAGRDNTGIMQIAVGISAGGANTGDYEIAVGHGAGIQNAGSNSIGVGFQAIKENAADNVIGIGYNAGYQNTLANQFIVRQHIVNSVPLIQGNFATGSIGFNTASPGTGTSVDMWKATNPILRLTDTSTTGFDYDDSLGEFQFWATEPENDFPGVRAGIRARHSRSGTAHTFGDAGLAFGVSHYSHSPTAFEAMFLNSSGTLIVGEDGSVSERAKIVVDGAVSYDNGTYGYLNTSGTGTGGTGTVNTSIYATDRIVCSEFNATSDERIKSQITPVEDALAIINQFNVVAYNKHTTTSNNVMGEVGLIAQEAKTVYPLAVKTNPGTVLDEDGNWVDVDDFHNINYQTVFALPLRAIQQLDERLNALEEIVHAT